jgi:uncharacterized protein YhaN
MAEPGFLPSKVRSPCRSGLACKLNGSFAAGVLEKTGRKEASPMTRFVDEGRIPRALEAAGSEDVPPLAADVRGLSRAIKDLEAQLKSFIKINKVLESDLADARRQVTDLNEERDAMVAKVQDLARALASSEHGVHEMMRLVDRLRAERDDASEEAACLNTQFSEAMAKIEELHCELEAHRERKQELEVRVKRLQRQLYAAGGAGVVPKYRSQEVT